MISLVLAGQDQTNAYSELTGQWVGKGKIIVSWCELDSLEFDIEIQPDGTVTGSVGNAMLNNAKIKRNNWILRFLKNPEFIISGNLEGPLIETEAIFRKSVHYLMLDKRDENHLDGGFHSSGWHFGGKNKMVFSVFGISLERKL